MGAVWEPLPRLRPLGPATQAKKECSPSRSAEEHLGPTFWVTLQRAAGRRHEPVCCCHVVTNSAGPYKPTADRFGRDPHLNH
jgi:hypothetical protein